LIGLLFKGFGYRSERVTLWPTHCLVEKKLLSISEIGGKLGLAGRLTSRPLCVYGSNSIPDGTRPSTSINRCVARAILTLAFRNETPSIYVDAEQSENCCPGGLAHFGFTKFNPGIKYFVSTGSEGYRNGAAEFLRATPELVEENQKRLGKITPLGRYVVIQPCVELTEEDPGVKSVLCFGTAEQIRNMVSLIHFRSVDPFHDVLVPQGPVCASFVSYAAAMVETSPPDTAFIGPSDPTGNVWFPEDHLSLAIPIKIARRMADDLEDSFIAKRPFVAYPRQRAQILS
jgi:hypothetical protein